MSAESTSNTSGPGSDLVSTEWLADRLRNPDIVVLDASRHLPQAGRDAEAEFAAAHIPGARFLDLATLTDPASEVPSALPDGRQLAERLSKLGVRSGDTIVLYDDSAVKTSARAWVAMRAHGYEQVAILDGGLAKWRNEGRPLESGMAAIQRTNLADFPPLVGIASKSDVLLALDDYTAQIVDARGADRVFGTGIDPVHGGQNGRIPGSLNLPFGEVFAADGTFRSPGELRQAFDDAGVDWSQPVITTCGSGVTASVLLFAMHLAGKDDVALYDGSWQEWEADPATPKQQGSAEQATA